MWTRKSSLTSSSAVLFPNLHHVVVIAVAVCIFWQLLYPCEVQALTTSATTDPSEVQIINSIFQKWGIEASADQWNISGEPCSGAAIDDTSFDDRGHNPFIKCDCSYDNGTTCHITQLKVYALSVSGSIPDELWNLTYLSNLKLDQNLLTGSLSPAVGNLTQMQYFSVGINALSGEFPAEIVQLTKLKLLAFGTNNFSGSLPSEIGNLQNLEEIYFDSSGLSGEIPTTFANLKKLTKVWASDNALTGKIPDFIGSLPNLTQLILRGNAFEGPIPLAISNLTSLTDLRISDVTNGSSSVEFIKGLTKLTTLILRNNKISDSIPSYIGDYQSLLQLDLSFNNLVGHIPDVLFNLTDLEFLFLSNNSLNGTLPALISQSLSTLDVSYNDIMGSLPTWVNEPSMQLNLVGNNFTIDSNNISSLPAGLHCLQQNFPCTSGAGIYYNFSIKCGGPEITSSKGIVFERDNETLGPATYYVTDKQRWAVSNVGYFTDNSNPTYILSSLSQFTNTLDPELFQTARISASSLRYYGLGLENGNYTVTLQFAEISIQNSQWQNLGRRIFDIYIQGTLEEKDFDIRKEAGGSSFVAVEKVFGAQVTRNYLEIHLFWAGKGTCCVPAQATYGPLISAISATPDFEPTVGNNPPALSNKKDQTGLIVGIVVGVGVVGLSVLLLMFCIVRQRRRAQAERDEELLGIDVKPYTFSYGELRAATEDFNPINKLGEGGFGPVFKGMLNDGRVIAVKQLSLASHQGKNQFVTEIATISAVQHRNLVKLYGCCIEGDQRLLVYEYLENKSLDQALFGEKNLVLEWATRYEICLGIARGLAYLHEESRLRIVHRDVKASNILLDSNLVPKISDFGLAKLYDDKKTHISTRVAGTIGYLAPEYAMRGHLTEKADVFAFGVVALEIISGRPNSDPSLEEDKVYLLELAWHLHETNREVDLVDSRLSAFNEEEVKRMVGVALLCTQTSPAIRPSMSRIVAMLSGDIDVSSVATKPGYLTDWKFTDQTSFMNEISRSKGAQKNDYASQSSGTASGANLSPTNASTTMIHEVIGEGR